MSKIFTSTLPAWSMAAAMLAASSAYAHDPDVSMLVYGQNGKVAVTDGFGAPLPNSIWRSYFTVEREWDERAIYDHVNLAGTPIDASGNAAYTGGNGMLAPHIKGSGGVKNPDYVVDDYAWRYYSNAATLSYFPGADGSVDNKPVRLELVSALRIWNGTTFATTSGNSLAVSTWTWEKVSGGNLRYPDGGWYAYPDSTVSPNGGLVQAGAYEFAPGDHYHWLLELNGNRDAGVYALRVRMTTTDGSLSPSDTFDLLLANGLGPDWESSTNNLQYQAALGYLAANPNSLVAAVPEPETYALLLAGLGLMGTVARRRSRNRSAA